MAPMIDDHIKVDLGLENLLHIEDKQASFC